MTQFQAQMMLVAGMVLLGWVMVRRKIHTRHKRRTEQHRLEGLGPTSSTQGAPLVDAPRSVLRWQAAMFDLQRDLTAELDTRVAVVQTLLRQADEKLERLERLVEAPAASAGADPASPERDAPAECSAAFAPGSPPPSGDRDGSGETS